jgi:hypothetical protein
MKHVDLRHAQTVADPRQRERVLRALRIRLAHQEDAEASRPLCQSGNTPSAPGGYQRQPGTRPETRHASAGLEPPGGPCGSRCRPQRRPARPPGAGSAA